MIYRVIIQPEAQADMESSYGWIAEESPTRAARWYNGLLDAVEGLKQFPQRCGLAPENDTFKQEIRQLLYGTCCSVSELATLLMIRAATVRERFSQSETSALPYGRASDKMPST
ncbi:MAG: type II toxin-antitoxin system RelE/ParE family toxin [Phycisphaerae bacterium]